MSEKKVGVLFLFMIVLFVGMSSAATISCSVVPRASCTGTSKIVMGLSDLTNAHGEISGTYPYVLCCSGGSASCSGTNIINLFSTNNAHAEIPTGTAYSTNVCYGNLTCVTGASCSASYPIPTVSLSADTNAHIGNSGAYSTKICCKESTTPPAPEFYWSGNSNGVGEISTISVNVGITTVYMVAKDSSLTVGETVNYNIKEKDVFGDDTITSKSTTVTTDGIAIAEWIITQTDLDKDPERDYNNFRFTTDIFGVPESGGLIITTGYCPLDIPLCSSYDEAYCASDTCDVAISDGAAKGIDCSESGKDCRCIWDATEGCGLSWNGTTPRYCGNNITGPGEECDGNDILTRDWGGITSCIDFSLIGTLSCNSNCKFTGCIGSVGTCGDGVINTGETCDGTNMSGKTCTDFDEFISWGGDLSCGTDCKFDTSKCKKDPTTPQLWGSCEGMDEGVCKYTDDVNDDNCNDGFFGYSWNADWTWNPLNNLGSTEPSNWDNPSDLIFDTSANVYRCNTTSIDCHAGSKIQACPAKIELPFFGLMNFVIAVIAIALIYVALNKKKRKH